MIFNTDNWKWFRYDEVFIIKGSKTTPKDILEEYGNGIYPYVTTQAENNGIDNYYDFYTENGIVFTVDSAVLGFCAYQELNFSASDHVEKLIPRFECNKFIALFITTLINKEQYRYSYGRKCNQTKLKKSKIKLPITSKGKPDWDFIENYVKTDVIQQLPSYAKAVWTNTYDIKPINKNKISLNTDNWKWFIIDEIFNIKKGERLVQSERVKGDTALITASSENNGVVDYISYQEFIDSKKCFKNKITMDMFCNVFYHNYNYFSDDNVHTLIFKEDINNVYISLFLVAILQKLQYKYKYGRQLRLSKLKYDKIKLPVTSDNKPNWKFMENYIKSLPYSKSL